MKAALCLITLSNPDFKYVTTLMSVMVRGPGETVGLYVVYGVTGSSQFWFVEKPQKSYWLPAPLGKVTIYLSTAVTPGAAATLIVLPAEIT